jgi:hypothetical protein
LPVPVICQICFLTFFFVYDRYIQLANCSHTFCEECLHHTVSYLGTAVPSCTCHEELTLSEIKQYVPLQALERFSVRAVWRQFGGFQCPECPEVLTFDKTSADSPCVAVPGGCKCPKCATEICFKCQRKAHLNTDCIANEEDTTLADFLTNAMEDTTLDWTTCPVCKHAIQRIEGCDHITCACGAEFCFHCRVKVRNFYSCLF